VANQALLKSWVVIAGVVAAASVLVGVLYLQPALFAAKEPSTTMTIEGLKDTYRIGEPIDFVVRIDGHGCDTGFPSVGIIKASTGETIWSRLGEIRSFPAGYSCPHEGIHHAKHIGDVERYQNDEQDRLRTQGGVPIIIAEEGKYFVHVDGSVPTTKEFTVVKSQP
jgi:hypothetical protein